MDALKEYCTTWVTINEPNVYAMSAYVYGVFPPGKKSIKDALGVMVNLTRGHAAAYHAIHEIQKEARVGFAMQLPQLRPGQGLVPAGHHGCQFPAKILQRRFPGRRATGLLDTPLMKTRIPQAANTQDFLGVNYYSRDLVAFDLTKPASQFMHNFYPKGSDLSPTGFIANEPLGMYEALKWGLKFKVPMLVTENGVEDQPGYTASALPAAAHPPGVAGGQLQLAGEGLLPLVAGG